MIHVRESGGQFDGIYTEGRFIVNDTLSFLKNSFVRLSRKNPRLESAGSYSYSVEVLLPDADNLASRVNDLSACIDTADNRTR